MNYSLFSVYGKHVMNYMMNTDQFYNAWWNVNQKKAYFVGYHLASTDTNQNTKLSIYLLNSGLLWVTFFSTTWSINPGYLFWAPS